MTEIFSVVLYETTVAHLSVSTELQWGARRFSRIQKSYFCPKTYFISLMNWIFIFLQTHWAKRIVCSLAEAAQVKLFRKISLLHGIAKYIINFLDSIYFVNLLWTLWNPDVQPVETFVKSDVWKISLVCCLNFFLNRLTTQAGNDIKSNEINLELKIKRISFSKEKLSWRNKKNIWKDENFIETEVNFSKSTSKSL